MILKIWILGTYIYIYLPISFFRREPTLALSEYPVKNWSFWQKLSEVYDNLEIIKKQRSLYGLSFPAPNENLESKRVTPSSKDRTETRNSRSARYQNDDNQNQAYYMTRQT